VEFERFCRQGQAGLSRQTFYTNVKNLFFQSFIETNAESNGALKKVGSKTNTPQALD
jgi:hypothetical protein